MGEHNGGLGTGQTSRGAGVPLSCGIPVWKHRSLLRLSFSLWFIILSSFAGLQSWTWHWEAGAAVDLPAAAGGPRGPALGWAALRRKKTEGHEVQRGKTDSVTSPHSSQVATEVW